MPVSHQQETRLQEVLDAIRDCLKSVDEGEDRTARVAYALLEYAGPPSANGVNNDSDEKIRGVAAEVKRRFDGRGSKFTFDYLRQLRRTASKFPAGERSPGIPFSWMSVACDPKTLGDAIAEAKRKGKDCSANFIRTYRKHIEDKKRIDDKASDHDHASALVLLQEVETQLVENHRYFCKFPQRCTKECKKWSDDQRQVLATAADKLITALVDFKAVVQPAKGVTLEAAE
jgi:hypothetical protein